MYLLRCGGKDTCGMRASLIQFPLQVWDMDAPKDHDSGGGLFGVVDDVENDVMDVLYMVAWNVGVPLSALLSLALLIAVSRCAWPFVSYVAVAMWIGSSKALAWSIRNCVPRLSRVVQRVPLKVRKTAREVAGEIREAANRGRRDRARAQERRTGRAPAKVVDV
jgi:hypothetical protein